MNKKHLTLAQAGEMLSVHRDTIYRWVKAGAIEAVVMPSPSGKRNSYRIHIDTVKKLLTPQTYGNGNTKNKKDTRSGCGTLPTFGSAGGDSPGMEQSSEKNNVPVQK